MSTQNVIPPVDTLITAPGKGKTPNPKKPRKKQVASRARHRLLSIHRDAQNLVKLREILSERVPSANQWPLVANERCGSWYLSPPHPSCYFKSTDGHVGTWNMSLKRLNLPLLTSLNQHGGCLLVDSSVRKLLPDSFSRTIPIWACVLNRIILKYREMLGMPPPANWDTKLYTPSCIVSVEEHSEISDLLDDRVESLFTSKAIVNPQQLVQTITKPLRAIWISNGGELLEELEDDHLDQFLVIACCNPSMYNTISKSQIQWIESAQFYYTPGAADDHESWARHLTPTLFWKHPKQLVDPDRTEEEIEELMDLFVSNTRQEDTMPNNGLDSCMDRIGNTSIWIGSRRAGRPPDCWNHLDAILNVTEQEYPNICANVENRFYLQLSVAEGKRDRTELERWMSVGLAFLIHHLQQGRRILVHCAQGKDRSVAMVLALVVLACPLVFPLQQLEDFDKWDFESLCQEVTSNASSETSEECNDEIHMKSGLPKSLVSALLQENGHDMFLLWCHAQLQHPVVQPLANKESLRIGLHLIRQDREVADPTRSTMQKLNRFFMSSPLYR
jgi:tRNA A64-2'-O-ribosylphosphate transferase